MQEPNSEALLLESNSGVSGRVAKMPGKLIQQCNQASKTQQDRNCTITDVAIPVHLVVVNPKPDTSSKLIINHNPLG
jgi:hypothetical protein